MLLASSIWSCATLDSFAAQNKETHKRSTANLHSHKTNDIDDGAEYAAAPQYEENKSNTNLQYQLLSVHNAGYDDDPQDFVDEQNHFEQQQQHHHHQHHNQQQTQFIYDKQNKAIPPATHNSPDKAAATFDYEDYDNFSNNKNDARQTVKPTLLQQLQSQQQELSEGYAVFLRAPQFVKPPATTLAHATGSATSLASLPYRKKHSGR